YSWAWLATASARRHLLIRRSLHDPADLAYFLCHVPAGRACSFTTLVRAAGRRWPVEEDLCATRRSAVFPAQPGGTWREVSGSDGLPGAERLMGTRACQETSGRAQALGAVRWGTRA